MPDNIEAYPLCWPEGWLRTPNHLRQPVGAKFGYRLTLAKARDLLLHELRLLGTSSVILSTNVRMRKDGLLRGDERPVNGEHGAAAYFELRKRPLCMAYDRFTTVEANIRAIALAIEHLRGLQRHGGDHIMERAFTGFAALPPPGGRPGSRPWRDVLGMPQTGITRIGRPVLMEAERLYRDLARRFHPDSGNEPDAYRMAEINQAIADARQELRT